MKLNVFVWKIGKWLSAYTIDMVIQKLLINNNMVVFERNGLNLEVRCGKKTKRNVKIKIYKENIFKYFAPFSHGPSNS